MFNFCQFPFGQKRKNILLRRWRFECLREANYREFCHPQGRSRGPSKQLQAIQHGNFRGNITLLSSVEFHFLGSFIHFSRWLGLRGTFCGFKIVGTVPFANFLVSDRAFKMCFLSKCSEHICKFFTDSNSLSAPRQKFSISFQASPCSENRKNLGLVFFQNDFYTQRWHNTSFFTCSRSGS